MVPMPYHSRKDCNNNNMDFVNDFHIHTEVSSAERGNHLQFAKEVCSQGKEMDGVQRGVRFQIFPSPCWFVDTWKSLMGFPTEVPGC